MPMSMDKLMQTPAGLIAMAMAALLLSLTGGSVGVNLFGPSATEISAEVDRHLEKSAEVSGLKDQLKDAELQKQLAEIKAQIAKTEASVLAQVAEMTMRTQDRVYRPEIIKLEGEKRKWAARVLHELGYLGEMDIPELPPYPTYKPR